jgi:hypothetical protein
MGTVGQPGPAPALAGGGFILAGGFWQDATSAHYRVFLPLAAKDYR